MTSVMRGEVAEEVVVTEGTGDGCSEARIVPKQVSARDRLEASMARVSAEWDKLITMQSEAEYLIAQVPNVRYQAILLDRYITGLSWTAIGKALHYNLYGNGVFKLHARALKSFQSVHKNTLKQVI